MSGRQWLFVALLMVTAAGCSKMKLWNVPTDDPNWVLGHQQGVLDGKEEAREEICTEIRRYKEAIAYDLNEHTQICGWGPGENPPKKP